MAAAARGSGKKKFYFRRRKVCRMCADKVDFVDYKDIRFLQQYLVERSKILPRRITGTSAKNKSAMTVPPRSNTAPRSGWSIMSALPNPRITR